LITASPPPNGERHGERRSQELFAFLLDDQTKVLIKPPLFRVLAPGIEFDNQKPPR
jgi:hypothetical protein